MRRDHFKRRSCLGAHALTAKLIADGRWRSRRLRGEPFVIKTGEIVWASGNPKFRVIDVVSVEEEESQYVGLPKIEPA
jgi:hypothetical protein